MIFLRRIGSHVDYLGRPNEKFRIIIDCFEWKRGLNAEFLVAEAAVRTDRLQDQAFFGCRRGQKPVRGVFLERNDTVGEF